MPRGHNLSSIENKKIASQHLGDTADQRVHAEHGQYDYNNEE